MDRKARYPHLGRSSVPRGKLPTVLDAGGFYGKAAGL